MLVALVERIKVSGALRVEVKFRYMDEFAALMALMEEHGEQIPGGKEDGCYGYKNIERRKYPHSPAV